MATVLAARLPGRCRHCRLPSIAALEAQRRLEEIITTHGPTPPSRKALAQACWETPCGTVPGFTAYAACNMGLWPMRMPSAASRARFEFAQAMIERLDEIPAGAASCAGGLETDLKGQPCWASGAWARRCSSRYWRATLTSRRSRSATPWPTPTRLPVEPWTTFTAWPRPRGRRACPLRGLLTRVRDEGAEVTGKLCRRQGSAEHPAPADRQAVPGRQDPSARRDPRDVELSPLRRAAPAYQLDAARRAGYDVASAQIAERMALALALHPRRSSRGP